ncbi:SDR family NAD(P)-dependent oxidoreductase [candidate division WOR-3 bacterium]|nr:SDR family NAD(P)-dependent oxidoreductase [candidate division WOR-3 bacterium]
MENSKTDKRICLITGANSGIGKAAAIQIARQGYRVIIGCRNKERGETALSEIKEKSNSDDVELMIIDMALQKSIRAAVEALTHNQVDVLIHNAADFDITRKKREVSGENIETVWATNHLGPVLMTDLLTERLKRSEQGRIITIASKGLVAHPFLKVDIEDPEFKSKSYSVEKAYYQSKLAQVMYAYWLAQELKDTEITVNCIRVTNVKIDIERYPNLSKAMKLSYSMKSKFAITPEEMALTYTYLATSPEVNSVTGKYFDEKNKEVSSSAYSRDEANIAAVMDMTMKYLK